MQSKEYLVFTILYTIQQGCHETPHHAC